MKYMVGVEALSPVLKSQSHCALDKASVPQTIAMTTAARSPGRLRGMEAAVAAAAGPLHAGEKVEAANALLAVLGQREITNEPEALLTLNTALRWCLDRDRKDLASRILWTGTQFSPDPRSVRMIWNAVERYQFVGLMGASSMGKTYTPGVNFFLEWLRDPQYTLVRAIGPSENHLRDNLFSHLVQLHQNASIPLPGNLSDLFIGLDSKTRKGGIIGLVLPQGRANKGAGRLQGGKRTPRKRAHPAFGLMSRLFILLDELENIAAGIFTDINNVVANIDNVADLGFKLVASWNPKDPSAPPAQLACPQGEGGWKDFDIDAHEEWDSVRGFHIVRLDAERCENVVQGATVFPGLQTRAGLDKLVALSGGKKSPAYYTFGRGAYPPQGTDQTLFRDQMLNGRLGVPLWVGQTYPCGGNDLALGGGDHAKYASGTYGMATGVRLPGGAIEPFRDVAGTARTRPVIWVAEIDPLAKADSVQMAKAVMQFSVARRIEPPWLALDRTGVGAGVHDILSGMWGPVQGINYSQAATERRILEEDQLIPKDEFKRIDSELWIALRRLVEHGFVWFSPSMVLRPVLWQQLCARKYDPSSGSKVESKTEYTSRGNPSPDEADSVTLLVHAARIQSGASFSVQRWQTIRDASPADSLYGEDPRFDPVIDPTNRVDSLAD